MRQPTEMEMRVAAALADSVYRGLWDILDPEKKANFVVHARAAIRAMHELSEEQKALLSEFFKHGEYERVTDENTIKDDWNELIDAASPPITEGTDTQNG